MTTNHEWYLYSASGQQGPYTPDEIRRRQSEGYVTDDWYVWREGLTDWQKLGDVEEFRRVTAMAPLPPPIKPEAPPKDTSKVPSPVVSVPVVAVIQPEPARASAKKKPPAHPQLSKRTIAFIHLKLIFIKAMQYLELCAIPYLIGIALAVGFRLKVPAEAWEVFSALGVTGTMAVILGPIILLHALYIRHLKNRSPGTTYAFFLEDRLGEHGFTRVLAGVAMVLCVGFGILNYNFATDTTGPDHITNFIAKPWERKPVVLSGKIIREPEFRDYAVWLYVEPDEIKTTDGAVKPVEGGLVLAKISRQVEGFEEFNYGEEVQLTGPLVEPEGSVNPGTFDYKTHLNNRNIFGLMNIFRAEDVESLGQPSVNPIVSVSLWFKEKFIGTMKQTLPFPQSSFQGGIIYGLKTGIPEEGIAEFKWAGMAWVLVVAGAHLLMVYLTLKMILGSIRPDPRVGFVALFGMLFAFLIITGINPPTVRAFIMLFLYEFTKTFLGQDISSAVRSAITIAALLLLASHAYPYFSPLMIFDPTVTLSFGAVLSLSFLSRPTERLLRRFSYGLTSLVLLGGVIATFIIMSVKRAPTLSMLFHDLLPVAAITLGLAALTSLFNNIYRRRHHLHHIYLGLNDRSLFHGWRRWIHTDSLSYSKLPRFVLGFLGAQLAIQFGMVLPLSSWYFQRSPVGGFLANIIAFPALGAIIQVGIVAALLGLIPVVGVYLAFVLNAADYLGIQLLLALAHYSKEFFPYPMASKPVASQMILYYAILIGFVMFDRIFYSMDDRGYLTLHEWAKRRYELTKSGFYGRLIPVVNRPWKQGFIIAVFAVVAGGSAFNMAQGIPVDNLRMTIMQLQGGAGTLIETPGGARFLVDAGAINFRSEGATVGERTIAPVILNRQVEHLDGVFLSSLRSENLGGMAFILENFDVEKLYVGFDAALLTSDEEIDDKLYRAGITKGEDLARVAETLEEIRAVIAERRIPVRRIGDGDIAHRDGKLAIETMTPAKNHLVLCVKYGSRCVLLSGDIDSAAEQTLVRQHPGMKPDVLLIPAHGAPTSSSEAFVNALKPRFAVVQSKRAPQRRGAAESDPVVEVMERYKNATTYRCDRNGGVVVEISDDGDLDVTPMVESQGDKTGGDDAGVGDDTYNF